MELQRLNLAELMQGQTDCQHHEYKKRYEYVVTVLFPSKINQRSNRSNVRCQNKDNHADCYERERIFHSKKVIDLCVNESEKVLAMDKSILLLRNLQVPNTLIIKKDSNNNQCNTGYDADYEYVANYGFQF